MGNEVSMSAPSGGGGFTFDADKIDGVIKKWQDLQTDLQNDAADANLMADVKAPGKEFASGDWEKLANPSGKAFLEQNQKMQEYVKNYIQALLDAKKKLTTADAEHTGDISKAGTQA
ncbi:hypothetical protein [Amycolatopsis australiensis]|uniref:Excreted virulence factor EspC, type VII ESX diderm n=1 Tax=Amycolatopsis australiensis TaxID=546364 RepID=A0A1K1Q2E6_9PSEU|nr:hypothetical protein [Amycolatopsis australiensis]SFW54079.1 hypothetical protein SAMN04489730_1287 [Amycolatopsis australiensis]